MKPSTLCMKIALGLVLTLGGIETLLVVSGVAVFLGVVVLAWRSGSEDIKNGGAV